MMYASADPRKGRKAWKRRHSTPHRRAASDAAANIAVVAAFEREPLPLERVTRDMDMDRGRGERGTDRRKRKKRTCKR